MSAAELLHRPDGGILRVTAGFGGRRRRRPARRRGL